MRLTKLVHNPWIRWLLMALGLQGIVQLLVVGVPALLTHSDWLKENAEALQGAGVLVEWFLRLAALLAPLVLRHRPEAAPQLLLYHDIAEEIGKRTDRGRTPWVPRTPNYRYFVHDHPRFIFRDAPGAGKSREALELLLVADGLALNRLLMPNWGCTNLATATPPQIDAALNALPLGAGPVVLWLDDLHRPRQQACREAVQMLIELLDQRFGAEFILVGTLRDTFSLGSWNSCLNRHHTESMSLQTMDAGTTRELASRMAQEVGVALNDEALQTLAEVAPAPELMRVAFARLALSEHSDLDIWGLLRALYRGIGDLWGQDRDDLVRAQPTVAYLLRVLDWFDAAGQTPRLRLVRALALRQIVGWKPAAWRERWELVLRRAERALLAHPYFGVIGGTWRVDDTALKEEADADQAAEFLEAFVRGFRKPLRRWPFRRLDPARDDAKWLAIGLGDRHREADRYRAACAMYGAALQIESRSHEALRRWANVLAAEATKLVTAGRAAEAEAAWDEAEKRYCQALTINKDYHWAASSWGNALASRAKWLASVNRDEDALAAWKAAGWLYAKALAISLDHHWAAHDWGVALAEKAEWLASAGRGEEALAAWEEAAKRYCQALTINKGFHWAAFGWGNALAARARWFASQKRGEDAVIAWDAAGERYGQALEMNSDFEEAADRWGDALAEKAGWLAETGRGEEALAAWEEAGRRYCQALAINKDYHWATFDWGRALAARARWLASVNRGEDAVIAWEAAGERYGQALGINSDFYEAADRWGDALAEKAGWFAETGRGEEALAAWEEAERCYCQALTINKEYHWAAYDWGHALWVKAHWLESVGRRDDALAPFAAAAEHLRQALAIKPDQDGAERLLHATLSAIARLTRVEGGGEPKRSDSCIG